MAPAVVRRARQADLLMLPLSDGAYAIYDRVTGATHLCDAVAGGALALCEHGVPREALIGELARAYGEEAPGAMRQRVEEAIAQLEGLGLIEITEP